MRGLRHTLVGFLGVVVCLGLAGGVHADTIVLKNGRRIVGSNITRKDGKVSCETPSGIVTVPESIVANIEKDGAGGASTMNPSAANLEMGPPPDAMPATDPAARSVIHDGSIDLDALSRIDAKALGGNEEAVSLAASSELLASRFAYDHADLNASLEHAERAASFAPTQLPLLLNVAYLHLRRAEYTAALDSLVPARQLAPDSADVAKLAGWANYGLNRLGPAISEWKHALELRPDSDLVQAISKAEHELAVEGDFREGDSAHFTIHYYGGATPELARDILQLLESDFNGISSLLNETPVEPISVILYTNQAFSDITRAPSWVGALNDGRIRIPVQGLVSVTPGLARVLKHELTHSFINEKTHGNCPVWLQEGVAQWVEGRRLGDAAPALLALYNHQADPSLRILEGSWLNLSADFASVAYAWSLAVVESIEANGPGDVVRLLDRIVTEPSGEAAVRSALRMSYADLNTQAAEYIRHNYMN